MKLGERVVFGSQAALDAGRREAEQTAAEALAVIGFERLWAVVGKNRDAVADDGVAALGEHARDVLANVGRDAGVVSIIRLG